MNKVTHGSKFRALLVVALTALLASCGGGDVQTPASNLARFGTSFVVGSDAPLGSVLAFQVTFSSLNVSDGTSTAALLSAPTDIEFARLNGLRNLIDMRSIPAGTYTTLTATISSPVISFLDTSTSPPTVGTMNGTLTRSSLNIPLPQPLMVNDGDLVGLFMDFRLGQSIQTDAQGQITGVVDPKIIFRVVPPDSPEAHIDVLRGGVISVNAAGNSFVMQGPHGRALTISTDANTMWEPGEDLTSLNTNSIVEVSGSLRRGTLNLHADAVQVVSRDRFVLAGIVTDVRPASGPADHADVLVRFELPDLPNAQVGRISTVDFDGNEHFMIHHFQMPLSFFLFNRSALLPGQNISAGGAIVTTTNPPTLDTRRVTLHRQGLDGGWIPGSTNVQNGNTGVFGFRPTGLVGQLFGQPVPVHTNARTRFINLTGLADLAGANPIPLRVVGLVLKDPNSGNPIVIAWAVERLIPVP
jgi:hypothetical protein